MKHFVALVMFCLAFSLSSRPGQGCSATIEPCMESCTMVAPPNGSANCFTQNGEAVYVAYDTDLNEVDRDTASCGGGNNSGGGGGGAGGGGAGGGGAGGGTECAIYWWLCDPWAY